MRSRKEIRDSILNQDYNIDLKKIDISILSLLKILYHCNCTDCGGNDSCKECEIEKDYYSKNKKYKKFTYV